MAALLPWSRRHRRHPEREATRGSNCCKRR